MDESAHRSKPDPEPPAPDLAQLLKLLELQTAARRDRRHALPRALQGDCFRYGSLILITIFAMGSVVFMEWFISQFPKPVHPAAAAGTPAPRSQEVQTAKSSP